MNTTFFLHLTPVTEAATDLWNFVLGSGVILLGIHQYTLVDMYTLEYEGIPCVMIRAQDGTPPIACKVFVTVVLVQLGNQVQVYRSWEHMYCSLQYPPPTIRVHDGHVWVNHIPMKSRNTTKIEISTWLERFSFTYVVK